MLAIQEWLRQQALPVRAMDVARIGAHVRRSRILYRKAFRANVEIGVIALDEQDYDPAQWWGSSEGMREVLFEGLACA